MNQILKSKLIWLGALLVAVSAPAQVTNNYPGSSMGFTGGDPAGNSSAITISGSEIIDSLTVTLDLAAGYNGALYAYLLGPDNTTKAILFNRVGVGGSDPFGYPDTGFSITFNDGIGADNIHGYGAGSYSVNGSGQVTGTWGSDGRDIPPDSEPPSTFDTAPTSANLSQFIGESPNGTWRLFVADVVGGDDNGMVNSWSLAVVTTPVPEPQAWALVGMGLIGLATASRRKQK